MRKESEEANFEERVVSGGELMSALLTRWKQ